jgi:hypothetical protein
MPGFWIAFAEAVGINFFGSDRGAVADASGSTPVPISDQSYESLMAGNIPAGASDAVCVDYAGGIDGVGDLGLG